MFCLDHSWFDFALGTKLAAVHKKNTNPAGLIVNRAQPNHSTSSPK